MTERQNAIDMLADLLGEQTFTRNITEPNDEQITVVEVDVESLAAFLTDEGYRRVMTRTEDDPIASAQRAADEAGIPLVVEYVGDDRG
ncbi:hypothetical protein QDA02_gp25 [Microbacterium phage Margaery]|uniref:Uncharacterized protein n=1 Tax=Microbacterium phage Margaery TaxID=2591217 RepID=A0A514DHP6_9CAUD|nr:hypothetical protein QDA02_gp25 [Microbacterium phage Margaery]QDH93140.1 hypothetical protein PBI_MARGAERY_83 [Microbacterium phage Margaery]